MSRKRRDHFFKKGWGHRIIAGRDVDQVPASQPDAIIPIRVHPLTGGLREADASILRGLVSQEFPSPIIGEIVHHHQFPVGEGLGKDGLQTLWQPAAIVQVRQTDRNYRRQDGL